MVPYPSHRPTLPHALHAIALVLSLPRTAPICCSSSNALAHPIAWYDCHCDFTVHFSPPASRLLLHCPRLSQEVALLNAPILIPSVFGTHHGRLLTLLFRLLLISACKLPQFTAPGLAPRFSFSALVLGDQRSGPSIFNPHWAHRFISSMMVILPLSTFFLPCFIRTQFIDLIPTPRESPHSPLPTTPFATAWCFIPFLLCSASIDPPFLTCLLPHTYIHPALASSQRLTCPGHRPLCFVSSAALQTTLPHTLIPHNPVTLFPSHYLALQHGWALTLTRYTNDLIFRFWAAAVTLDLQEL